MIKLVFNQNFKELSPILIDVIILKTFLKNKLTSVMKWFIFSLLNQILPNPPWASHVFSDDHFARGIGRKGKPFNSAKFVIFMIKERKKIS